MKNKTNYFVIGLFTFIFVFTSVLSAVFFSEEASAPTEPVEVSSTVESTLTVDETTVLETTDESTDTETTETSTTTYDSTTTTEETTVVITTLETTTLAKIIVTTQPTTTKQTTTQTTTVKTTMTTTTTQTQEETTTTTTDTISGNRTFVKNFSRGTYYCYGKAMKGGSGRQLISCAVGDDFAKGSIASSYLYRNYGYNYNGSRTYVYLEIRNYPEMNGYYYLDDSDAGNPNVIDFFYINSSECSFRNAGVVYVDCYIEG